MLKILENYSLKNDNTFGVEAKARWFCEISSEKELHELFEDSKWRNTDRLILGGGSNILFTKDFDGLVIKTNIKYLKSTIQGEHAFVSAGGGVDFPDPPTEEHLGSGCSYPACSGYAPRDCGGAGCHTWHWQ